MMSEQLMCVTDNDQLSYFLVEGQKVLIPVIGCGAEFIVFWCTAGVHFEFEHMCTPSIT